MKRLQCATSSPIRHIHKEVLDIVFTLVQARELSFMAIDYAGLLGIVFEGDTREDQIMQRFLFQLK